MSLAFRSHLQEVRQEVKESAGNRLLDALPYGEYERLLPYLESVRLNLNEVIYESGQPLKYVYFPVSALVSVLSILEDGTTVEVWMVGSSGMVGVASLLGAKCASHWTVVQVAGEALRMEVCALTELLGQIDSLRGQLTRYYRGLITHISQRAVCNARHMVMQRLCTWLLMARDCLGSTHLPLTQDLISRRLGSRRASVTQAMGDLQQMGIIDHGRGYTSVIDPGRLETFACECYAVISTEPAGDGRHD